MKKCLLRKVSPFTWQSLRKNPGNKPIAQAARGFSGQQALCFFKQTSEPRTGSCQTNDSKKYITAARNYS